MGISGSIYWQDQPEIFTEDEMRAIFQNEFDESLFIKLRDANGNVKRDHLMQALNERKQKEREAETREIYRLFMAYCPSGHMNARAFTHFLRDAKLLKKNIFTTPDAAILFERAKVGQATASDASTNTLHFPGFMKIGVPLLAEKICMPADDIVHRLARVEYKDNHQTIRTSASKNMETSGQEVVEERVQQSEQDLAASKLQAVARRRQARRHMQAIKQLNSYHEGVPENFFSFPNPDKDDQLERKLHDVFLAFAPTGELDGSGLVNMLREASLFDQKFTPHCSTIAFMKSRHIAAHTPKYETKVVLNKRLLYDAFREVALPCVAEAKEVCVPTILDALKVISTANVDIIHAGSHKKDAMHGMFVNGIHDQIDEVEQMQKLFQQPE